MKCVKCGSRNYKLYNTRKNVEHTIVKRQRKCLDCGAQWDTYEFDEGAILTQNVKQLMYEWKQAKTGE